MSGSCRMEGRLVRSPASIPTGWISTATPCWAANQAAQQGGQGEHLKNKCKLWALTWQKEMGWPPEAG